MQQDDHQDEVAPNWLCEDDLENYWLRNCFVLHPTITTCMDELAILKHTGDVTNLELAMKRQFEEQQKQKHTANEDDQKKEEAKDPNFFYNFDFLAQLFVGQCIKVDGDSYCPSEPIHVSKLEPAELAKHRCAVFDDIVIC